MVYNERYLVDYDGKHSRLCRNIGLTVRILLIAFMQGDITREVPIVSQIAGRAVLDISGTKFIQKHNSIIPDLLQTHTLTYRLGYSCFLLSNSKQQDTKHLKLGKIDRTCWVTWRHHHHPL